MCNYMIKVASLFLIFFSGCDYLSMDTLPTEEFILNQHNVFLVEAKEINGIYRNLDVDATLFSYQTQNSEVLSIIESALLKENWFTHQKNDNELVVFKNSLPGKGELDFHSFELAKISVTTNQVCVGYVQMDSRTPMTITSKTSESKWANKYFWPKYDKCKNT